MSPRRSSRARSSAQPPPPPSQTASSGSTSTMKNPRAAQRSESIDDPNADDEGSQSQAATSEPVMPRRSRRNGIEETKQNTEPKIEDEEEPGVNEDEDQEEEITRCICGNAEYPGPTPHAKELAKGIELLETLGDDLGNFFVQCDHCSVWQHGGCMGLIDEQNLPDQYFCEQCKPEFHRIVRGSTGTKSSRYLPVLQAVSSRASSLSSSDPKRRDSKGKQSEPAKRRATMNSRVAYDEDEMLRRAIEESREMGTLGKRSREDGDDLKLAVKRQRTGSGSSETASMRSQSPMTIEEIPTRVGGKGKQNLRGAVAKNNREREMRDKQKEQAAAVRAEAASKRMARSERRRGDDSPPPTPSLSPSKHLSATNTTTTKSKADTPTPTSGVTTKPKSKAPRSAPMRKGRLGRNQYTRDRDRDGGESDTPMRDTSHERNGHPSTNTNGNPGANNNANGVNGDSPQGKGYEINGKSGRSSKAKTHPARTSMNEMKRRVAAILEFVGQMQTQSPRTANASGGSSAGKAGDGGGTPNELANGSGGGAAMLGIAGIVKAVQAAREDVEIAERVAEKQQENVDKTNAEQSNEEKEKINGEVGERKENAPGDSTGANGLVKLNLRDDGDFKGMGSVDMMETLSRELVAWQRVYGVYSR